MAITLAYQSCGHLHGTTNMYKTVLLLVLHVLHDTTDVVAVAAAILGLQEVQWLQPLTVCPCNQTDWTVSQTFKDKSISWHHECSRRQSLLVF